MMDMDHAFLKHSQKRRHQSKHYCFIPRRPIDLDDELIH